MSTLADLRPLRAELTDIRATHGRGSWQSREAFERLFRTASQAGHPLDALRRYVADETERFFANTVPGVDGHVYWDGGSKGFTRNDGKIRVPRRWWWTHISGRELDPYEDLVPSCGEKNCINPEHAERGRSPRRLRFSIDQMLGAVQVAALRLGRPPTSREWDRLGLSPTKNVYRQRFGSWAAVIRAAGLTYVAPPCATPAKPSECIAALRFLRKRLGHWPSVDEYLASSALLRAADLPTSPSTIRRHLGTWVQARKKAGAKR